MVEVKDVALTLQQLASIEVSKFDAEKQLKNVTDLMLPVLLPQLYGEHNEQVIRVATDLLWFAHCHGHGHGRDEPIVVHDEGPKDDGIVEFDRFMFRVMWPMLDEE